jgi:hypothetical protein
MEIVAAIALGMGAAWASGINLYATMATLGLLGATGHMHLPPDLQILASPVVIAAAAFMYCVEFFADKTPGVDTGWDAIHTFIRIPAGAVIAAGALGDISPAAQVAALIIGGGVATTSHTLKAGTRVLINASPEPVSNWIASTTEDVAVIGGMILAVNQPEVFLGLLGVFLVAAAWALPRLWRTIRTLLARIGRLFGRAAPEPEPEAAGGLPVLSLGGQRRLPRE